LHPEKDLPAIWNGMRRGECNVWIAKTIVDEGVSIGKAVSSIAVYLIDIQQSRFTLF